MTCTNKQYSVIQLRRGSNSEFISSNPVLASGEPAFAVDQKLFKVGDGTSPWIDLPGITFSGSLLQFAPISSNDLATLITDETGSGLAVFNTSPSFSGIPTAPTASSGTNTDQIATTAFVRTEVSNLVDSAPVLLDTLNEIAAAINDDASFFTTISNTINSVSGSIPFVTNSGDNRLVTSDGTARGLNAESNLTFDGSSLLVGGTAVSLSGHTHTSSNITDFASSVSGLLPVKNIIAGTGINVSNTSGIYTVSSIGSGIYAEQAASIVTTVFNKTGSQIPKMSAVFINGGQGDQPTIQLAIATSDQTSAATYGITYEAINDMSTGRVVVLGALTGVNTDQFNPTAPVGDVNGTILYLSPTTSGALTTTKPSAPNHIVSLATIVRTHQNAGVIEVRVQNGFELEELHNVAVSGVANGRFLQYNSASGLWIASSSGNFTTLQVNNVPVPTGTGISGNIAYWDGTNSLSYDNNQLFWDATNNRLGIGTGSPSVPLQVIGSGIFTSGVRIGDSSTNAFLIGPSGNTYIRFNNAAFNWIELASNTYTGSSTYISTQGIYLNGAATYVNGTMNFPKAGNTPTSTATQRDSNSIILYNRLWDGSAESAPGNEILSKASTTVNLRSRFAFLMQNEDGSQNRTERFSVLSNGNIGVGTTSPTHQLHVIGTGNFSQNLLVNGTGVSLTGHTHTSSDITGFTEAVQDVVGASGFLLGASGITVSYNDSANTLTITGGGGGGATISNTGNNRVLTSDGTSTGINAESNMTFDGTSLIVTGNAKFTQIQPTVVDNGNVSGSVGTDVSTGQIFDMTVTGSTTLSNPTNSVDGVTIRWRIKQDGTGGHSISLDTKFQIPSSASSPLPWSTAANAMDILAATYHAGRDKWDIVAFVPGY